jgi:hypothetical protein
MIIGSTLLTALGGALLATLLYGVIAYGRQPWPARLLVALFVFGAVVLFIALNGPIRIGQ